MNAKDDRNGERPLLSCTWGDGTMWPWGIKRDGIVTQSLLDSGMSWLTQWQNKIAKTFRKQWF